MINKDVRNILRCVKCNSSDLNFNENSLVCNNCNSKYLIHNNVPSLLVDEVDNQEWNPWKLDEAKMTADSYYKRANQEIPEKESSKSLARLILKKKLFTEKDKYLDIGCAAGHYLVSLRKILDKKIKYTGIDISKEYLLWGDEIFGHSEFCNFIHCDSLNLPFKNKSFDYTLVNLFHFFPELYSPLKEALRVTKKMLIWRTPIGEITYMIKWVLNEQRYNKIGSLHIDRKDLDYCIYMLYSEEYIKSIVQKLNAKVLFIEQDNDFKDFDNTSLKEFKNIPSTKTINGMQMNGNLHLDWKYVGIEL